MKLNELEGSDETGVPDTWIGFDGSSGKFSSIGCSWTGWLGVPNASASLDDLDGVKRLNGHISDHDT